MDEFVIPVPVVTAVDVEGDDSLLDKDVTVLDVVDDDNEVCLSDSEWEFIVEEEEAPLPVVEEPLQMVVLPSDMENTDEAANVDAGAADVAVVDEDEVSTDRVSSFERATLLFFGTFSSTMTGDEEEEEEAETEEE